MCRIRSAYIQLCVWWDETLFGSCGLVLWIRVMQRNFGHRSFRSVCLHSLVWGLWLHGWNRASAAFPPQRRQLPKRLWAPMLQESHELTTGLNYKVAFLQRSAFVSVKLVRLCFSSLSFCRSLFLTILPLHSKSKSKTHLFVLSSLDSCGFFWLCRGRGLLVLTRAPNTQTGSCSSHFLLIVLKGLWFY